MRLVTVKMRKDQPTWGTRADRAIGNGAYHDPPSLVRQRAGVRFPEAATVRERLMAFGISVRTLIIATSTVYALLRIQGDDLRRFTKRTAAIQERAGHPLMCWM